MRTLRIHPKKQHERILRVIVSGIFGLLAAVLFVSATPPPPQVASEVEKQVIWTAYQDRYAQFLAENQDDPITVLFEPVLDEVFLSPDGKTAVIWLAMRDYTGRILGTEPGIALAFRTDGSWQVLLRGDPGWEETVNQLPDGYLPVEFSSADGRAPAKNTQTVRGYYLP